MRLAKLLRPEGAVLERLRAIARYEPERVAKAMEPLITEMPDPWRLSAYADRIEAIFQAVIEADANFASLIAALRSRQLAQMSAA